ncbi:hypothetical protein JTE90_006795 [Oedothorax gibbosus]|uniref:Uncharacterized protein n=1 Tax=Oedothorax gibbosus TaxID=931172 RepID=A0AAV6VPX2_9ARAC|nr:hypothetical protein JTE90_006795 [Oedothorax gibbosus]
MCLRTIVTEVDKCRLFFCRCEYVQTGDKKVLLTEPGLFVGEDMFTRPWCMDKGGECGLPCGVWWGDWNPFSYSRISLRSSSARLNGCRRFKRMVRHASILQNNTFVMRY